MPRKRFDFEALVTDGGNWIESVLLSSTYRSLFQLTRLLGLAILRFAQPSLPHALTNTHSRGDGGP